MDEHRRRRRRGVWLLLTKALLVGGLWTEFAVCSSRAAREWAEHVSAYRSARDPIEPQDFRAKDIPDADNAAVALREAARIDTETAVWKTYEKLPRLELPLTEKEIAALGAVVAANPAAFAGIDAAMKRSGLDWQIN